LIVNDIERFTSAYSNVDRALIAGAYEGNLRNSGEIIKIEDAQNNTVVEFRYEDGQDEGEQGWPTKADGEGFSLVVRSEKSPIESWSVGTAWRASHQSGGSPGVEEVVPADADIDADGDVDAADIDLMSDAVRTGDIGLDLNHDGVTDPADRLFMIEWVLGTTAGDSNLDRVFDSGDLVLVFRAGQYEDRIDGNSGWAEGDWDGDGDFTTSDLVTAFQSGSYVAAMTPLACLFSWDGMLDADVLQAAVPYV
jgi:hypothetical protein